MAKKPEKKVKTTNAKSPEEILTEEELNHIGTEAYRTVTFDAHFVTGKIVEFGILLTGRPLYTYQKMIAYRVIYALITFEGAVITILLSRQSGKSETLAFIANALSVLVPALSKVLPDLEPYAKGIRIGIFAPQSDQVWSTYNRALDYLRTENAELIMEDSDLEVQLERPTKYSLTNGSRMIGQVASKQSKIEGATHDLIFVEEAQDVDSNIVTKSIEPMLTSCVCAGTIVYDENGFRFPIEEHYSNKIIGFNEIEKTYEIDEVTWKTEKTTIKECVEVTFATGRTLRCSYDHPIYIKERKGGMYGRKTKFIHAEDLQVGTHVGIADEVNFFKGKKKMFDPRLVGMLIGDGSYRYNGMVRYCSCDHELLDYVKSVYKFTSYNSYTTKTGKLFEDGTIKDLCKPLRELGIYGQVGKNKSLPINIDTFRKIDLQEMIGGIFDTDGCVSINKNGRMGSISFSTCSEILVEEVFYLLEKFGTHSRFSYNKSGSKALGNGYVWVLTINEKRSILNFHKNFKFLIKYKQDNLEHLVKMFSNHKEKRDANYPTIFFDRVTKITQIGDLPVYNLTADKNHTYLCNNIITHNTNGTMIKCGTTGTEKNDFWYEIQRNRNRNRSQHDERLLDHWEFNYEKIFKSRREQYAIDNKPFHLYYERFVKEQMVRRGRDSTSFKLSYALEWDLESGMLITDKEFDSLTNKKKGHSISNNDIVIAGLDIGKDDASTVLTLGKIVWEPNDEQAPPKIEICGWLELHAIDYELQHQLIVDYLYENNVTNMYADYTGVGKPVVDRLRFAVGDHVNIEPFTFSTQSKSEMWFNMIDFIQSKRLVIPAHQTVRATGQWRSFEEQMKNCLKYYNGPYLVCHKSDGYHDDYVDSLALMLLANQFEQVPDDVEEDINPFFAGQIINRNLRESNQWLRKK